MEDELPGLPGPGLGEPAHEPGELGGRHGEDDQFAAPHDLRSIEDRYVGEDRLDAFTIGARGDAHERVPRTRERRTEHGPDAAGADDADAEAAVAVHDPRSGSTGASRYSAHRCDRSSPAAATAACAMSSKAATASSRSIAPSEA